MSDLSSEAVCQILKKGKRTEVLPEEIIHEKILTRLPIQYLVRFLSVSKSWRSLLSDPKFVNTHFARNINQNLNNYDCLIALKANGVMILSRFKETRIERLPLDRIDYLVGSINGLVCVYMFGNFSIWNPALRKSRQVDLAENLYRKDKNDKYYTMLLGFVWDHITNDFKLVSCYFSAHSRRGVVYSCNSDSWTDLCIPDSVFPNDIFRSKCTTLIPTAIVNNCPYWRYSNYLPQMRRKYTALVKFEITTNEFRVLPEFDCATTRGKDFDFVNIKDSLAVMVYRAGGIGKTGSSISSVDVYSLDELSGVWSKMYSVGPINFGVPVWNLSQGFKYGGEIAFNEEGKFFCYDPKTNVIHAFRGSSRFGISKCFIYTPTLVVLPGMKEATELGEWFESS